jgi:Helix-turn-helix domain
VSASLMGSVYGIELSHPQQAILLAMADHAQDDGTDVFPSIARLAWKTGYDDRQVKRIIKDLRAEGVLVEVAPPAQHRPTEYRIDLEAATKKPSFESKKARGDISDRGDIGDPRGDISDPPGVTPRPPEPSREPSEEPPPTSPPAIKSKLSEEIDSVWATYVVVMNPRGRGRELQPDDRKIIRKALKVGDVGELETAIRTCEASDYHMKRGKHKNRPGGRHKAIGSIFKPRATKGQTWRSRLEWWLDKAEELEQGKKPEFDVNAEAERIRREQEAD